MSYIMKGWSGWSPAKHTTTSSEGVITHGKTPHGHVGRSDSDNPGKEYTDEEMVEKDKNKETPDYYISKVKEEEEVSEGSTVIKSGDKEYVYTPSKKNKKNKKGTVVSRVIKKIFKKRGKGPKKRRGPRNLVTGKRGKKSELGF